MGAQTGSRTLVVDWREDVAADRIDARRNAVDRPRGAAAREQRPHQRLARAPPR